MDVRDALIQRATSRITRMREVLNLFDDSTAEQGMVGPKWNVRDLVGHFVFWTAEYAEELAGQAGRTGSHNVSQVNEATYRKNRRMSYVMLCPQLREAEQRFMSVLGSVDPGTLIGESGTRACVDAMLDHYDHHWPGLKAAAQRVV